MINVNIENLIMNVDKRACYSSKSRRSVKQKSKPKMPSSFLDRRKEKDYKASRVQVKNIKDMSLDEARALGGIVLELYLKQIS